MDWEEVEAFGQGYTAPAVLENYTGDKFFGGFGATKLFEMDYWTLRERSSQLFRENIYARGMLRRLVTNEINTGVAPEVSPFVEILGKTPEEMTDWVENVENRFILWGKNAEQCDWAGRDTFGAIQRAARLESLISGDVLVVLRQNQYTGLPALQLIGGEHVRTPLREMGSNIHHGVELDKRGRHKAYWVDGQRIAARGKQSGRRLAWLVYGTEKRLDDVRGEPILSIVLQSLKEIDRYRDSTQRKAVINSMFAMFIKKTEERAGSKAITGGAVRRNTVQSAPGSSSEAREFNVAAQIPGVVVEELQYGEEPVMKGGEGTDTNFRDFEDTIINAVAWANEIPPEIMRLAFSNNYSASQAAINEFKIYLHRRWAEWGETFCQPVYTDWLLSEALRGVVPAPGLLEAFRDPYRQEVYAAWVAAEWYGSIKPSTDMLKQARGSQILVAEGWSTNARESRALTGTKFSKNIQKLKAENEQKTEAQRPAAEFKKEFGENVTEV